MNNLFEQLDDYIKSKITISILPYESYKKFVQLSSFGEEYQMKKYVEYVLGEIERSMKIAKN